MKKTSSAQPISILLYHQIGHNSEARTSLDCFCRADQFYAHMAYLKESPYAVIGLRDAYEALFVDDKLRNPSIVLTFDDGDTGFYDLVFPILQEFEFPSVLFSVSGLLGQKTEWVKPANVRVPIMTAEQLRELHALGLEVGSHSINHPRLTQLTREQIFRQVYDSKRLLEDIVDGEISSFAYPHGDYNPMVIDAVRNSGYECAVTCLAEAANMAPNPFEIPRKYITYHDDLEKFILKLFS